MAKKQPKLSNLMGAMMGQPMANKPMTATKKKSKAKPKSKKTLPWSSQNKSTKKTTGKKGC